MGRRERDCPDPCTMYGWTKIPSGRDVTPGIHFLLLLLQTSWSSEAEPPRASSLLCLCSQARSLPSGGTEDKQPLPAPGKTPGQPVCPPDSLPVCTGTGSPGGGAQLPSSGCTVSQGQGKLSCGCLRFGGTEAYSVSPEPDTGLYPMFDLGGGWVISRSFHEKQGGFYLI